MFRAKMTSRSTHQDYKKQSSESQVKVELLKPWCGFQHGERIWIDKQWLDFFTGVFKRVEE